MDKLKLKCSQMSLSDLDVLKKTILSDYENQIKNSSNSDDKNGFIKESKKIEKMISELMLDKSIKILFE